MNDEHAHLDAAYVLGALSPAERRDFEEHLTTCVDCAVSVRQMAGLPGLLSRLGPDEVEGLADRPPLPSTLLPALLHEASVRRRRRRAWSAAGAVAAAAAVVVLAVTLTTRAGGGQESPPAAVASSEMTQIGQNELAADLRLKDVAWGTKMSIVCTYTHPLPAGAYPPVYSLVVKTRSGQDEQVARWRAVPGKVTTVDAATEVPTSDIRSVEVRTAQGLPVLRDWPSRPATS